jgi:hypothetical protein
MDGCHWRKLLHAMSCTHHQPNESFVQSGAVGLALPQVPVFIPPPMNSMSIDEQSSAHVPCDTWDDQQVLGVGLSSARIQNSMYE